MAATRTLTRDGTHVYLTLAATGGVWECPIDFESEALAEGWVFAAGPPGVQVGSPSLTKAQADSLYDPLGINLLDLDSKTAQLVPPGSITAGVLASTYSPLTTIAATATGNGTLAKGRHTPVNATSGARTMSLPTDAVVGVEVSVEKVDASANPVTISGTIRGVASSITLASQFEARTFLSEGVGSWRPISDHRTASSLDAQTDSPANALPSSAWIGINQPRAVAYGGKLYVGVTGDGNELYLDEYSERAVGGPLWLRRYYIGTVPNSVTKDDHNSPAVLAAPGKPLIVIYSGHSADGVLRWRKSTVNLEAGVSFGPERTLQLADSDSTAYAGAFAVGNTIYVLHRTGPIANFWSLSKSTDWGDTFTHLGHVISAPAQFYVTGALVGSTLRLVSAGHPTIATNHNVYYAEVDLSTGSITKSDGTVLGNLDGTSLPIAQTSLELIATPTAGQVLSEPVVSNTPTRQLAWTAADPLNIGGTGRYYYAAKPAASWVINPVATVGDLGVGSSWGAPHFPISPVTPNTIYLTRKVGSAWQLEKVTTGDGGATWTEQVIEAATITTQQVWPIDALDSTDLGVSVLADQITSYAAFTDWTGTVKPFPTTRKVRRWQPLGDTADRPPTLPYSRVGLYLPGTSGTYISTPDSVTASPTGSQRLEVDCALTSWANGTTQQTLMARYGFGGARSVKLFINTDGKIGLSWSADGTAALDLIPSPVPPFKAGERWQIRADLIPNYNGSSYRVYFWYRSPGTAAWTYHTSAQNTTTVLSVFDSTDPWEIGTRAGGTTDRATGTFYSAALMKIAGTKLIEWRGDVPTTTYRDVASGAVWTVNGTGAAFTAS